MKKCCRTCKHCNKTFYENYDVTRCAYENKHISYEMLCGYACEKYEPNIYKATGPIGIAWSGPKATFLTKLRVAKGLTVKGVAEKAGVSVATVKRIMQDDIGGVRTELAIAICEVLGITVEEAYRGRLNDDT